MIAETDTTQEMSPPLPNVRFRYDYRGEVVITLAPGQFIRHVIGRPTADGYCVEMRWFAYDAGLGVIVLVETGLVYDLHGRHKAIVKFACPLHRLHARQLDGAAHPDWTVIDRWPRVGGLLDVEG